MEKLVYGGDGLARIEGKVVLIPYVAPGEVVRASLDRVKNDMFRGRLLEVISPAAARVAPACPYFQRCGGCQYQHVDYALEVEQKVAILREVLRRVGKIEFDGEIAAITADPWGYRNRVQLHIDRGQVGYFEHGSRRLCAIEHCPIASPVLNQVIAKLNAQLARLSSFSGAVDLFTNENEVQMNLLDRAPRSVFSILETAGTTGPIEYAGFRVSRNSFFQVNRFLVDGLVACALEDQQGDSAVDLYAGVGLFSRHLAGRFQRVTAVEAGHSAFRDLAHNVADRVAAENSSVEEFLARLESTPDFILADPPRAGLGKPVVKELSRIRAPRVTIVACDPATLARDLQGLLAGGYRIEKIALVDLFPRTFHLETVVRLRR
ncbi:MAG: class I SAM-dependent RNA methyltransferase [Acidobacteriia bacterium]|nr:class I SAM-dependent RNA methyltransferase [Terriglobia bacterium]